ncbi:Pentatricopeptide repeat-containing protein [Acorus gramineus]|uniref:Pentatricopeptide repeat-containing protein n=1 Tax=Acorus gramineus TaxID=55184 RepID=A0AAV9AP63_ACOGR|nr:Pentatricopeptide repeat-containing protein [Acorus gramineus]
MEEPNVYVYNALIRGFVRCFSPVSALRSYVTMSRSHVEPTSYTFPSLIKACALASAIGFGESVHGRTYKGGFGSHVFVQASLIDLYSSSGKIEESKRVFDEMRERDAFSWTAMISAYVRVGDMDCAAMLFEEMPEKTTVSWNVMIGGHAKAGDVESAASFFDRMPGKDLVSWTSMISCYSQSKKYREAIETFKRMKAGKVSPDRVTMATVISACAHLGALKLGRELHLEMNRNGCDLDVYNGSALIDMYAKCGDMERSLLVFFKLHEKNLFCWNSLIEGLAVHGHGESALAMFHKMKREKKIEPNKVTFVSVLSACAHSGLVNEGRGIFESMTSDHSISPGVEHYGCMVDLLGRAGRIEVALQMIQAMEVEPNAAVWGALLGGCKLHRNMDVGRIAVKELMALEPENCGYYMLLTNMYAEAKWWSKVAGVRATMRGRGVEKDNKGSSWIEMEGVVYEFAACDGGDLFSIGGVG